MPEIALAIPGDLATPTGGYVYARRLMEALPAAGWQPRLLSLPDSFPAPDAKALQDTRAVLGQLAPGRAVVIDGLAFGALPAELLAAHRLRYIALVHHPLAAETGLAPATAAALYASERAALGHAAHVITTSRHTADRLIADYGVAATDVTVARPGTDAMPRARGSAPPLLLTVATLTPRKGHLDLVQALSAVKDRPWRAVFAGSTTRDPETTAAVRAAIAAGGLADRVTLTGALTPAEVAALYAAADVFILPSHYEGYGMAFAEAIAHGLPVIGCAAGAVPETVSPACGILVGAGCVPDLTTALARLLDAPADRAHFADAAWRAAATLPRWEQTAAIVAGVVSNLAVA